MTRFLHWRKMTWAIAFWSVASAAWAVTSFFIASPNSAAACAADAAVTAGLQTQADCVAAFTVGTQVANWGLGWITVVWLVGMAGLGLVWFSSRPLWRQGHGVRLRRLRRPLTQ